MKAIRTHFVGPSNTKGSRYIADDGDGNRITLSTDFTLTTEENHRRAALALQDKMKWPGHDLIGGYYRKAYYWVQQEKKRVD